MNPSHAGKPPAASSIAGARRSARVEPAEPLVGVGPGADRAGHRDRRGTAEREPVMAGRSQRCRIGADR